MSFILFALYKLTCMHMKRCKEKKVDQRHVTKSQCLYNTYTSSQYGKKKENVQRNKACRLFLNSLKDLQVKSILQKNIEYFFTSLFYFTFV